MYVIMVLIATHTDIIISCCHTVIIISDIIIIIIIIIISQSVSRPYLPIYTIDSRANRPVDLSSITGSSFCHPAAFHPADTLS